MSGLFGDGPSIPQQPAPLPKTLGEIDVELSSLGYSEGATSGATDRGGGMKQSISSFKSSTTSGRVQQLLDLRNKLIAAEDKIRRSTPRGREANILTGPQGLLSEEASKVLL